MKKKVKGEDTNNFTKTILNNASEDYAYFDWKINEKDAVKWVSGLK